MKKVLWLTSWYPNAADPFNGDFIKRQAEAVSLFQSLTIIYAGKSPLVPAKNISAPETDSPNLKEFILYYSSFKQKNIFTACRSLVSYVKKNLTVIRQLRENEELPDIVHVHVALKAGLIALFLKWRYRIPYLLTEHWTAYYPEAADSLFKKSWITRYIVRRIIKNAVCLLPVSEALGIQINRYWETCPYHQIPNVVNTFLFFPSSLTVQKTFRFIHISTMIRQKNPEGIVRSFLALLQEGFEAELILVGPLPASLDEFMRAGKIPPGKILHTGEIPYEQVALELRNANALVLFSDYENLPCVILEALCSGIPVIASRVGGIPEVIDDRNGILVSAGNEKQLQEAMKTMMLNAQFYQRDKISKQAMDAFSYTVVGAKMTSLYNNILDKK
jgi:glycosyltransferase involved in cell wall biosynthesis